MNGKEYKWDVFISYASEDRETVAVPLADALSKLGIKVWIDESELLVGDSLRQKIDEGLANSQYGIVILSPSFFAKEWPQRELDALFSRDVVSKKVILPIWHEISVKDVLAYSPLLAGKKAISTSQGIPKVVSEILRALFPENQEEIKKRYKGYYKIQDIDKVVDYLIRVNNISDIISLLTQDPPKTKPEYQGARNCVWRLIEECQPDYRNTSLDRPIALRVKENCLMSPFDLLGYWASCGVLSYALDDYQATFEYATGVQETACQFKDDKVLISGAKYTFGLSVFCLRHNASFSVGDLSPETISKYCSALLLDEEHQECARLHSKGARVLAASFHELAYYLWRCKYKPDGRVRNVITEDLIEPIDEFAHYIDQKTDFIFNLASWVHKDFLQDW